MLVLKCFLSISRASSRVTMLQNTLIVTFFQGYPRHSRRDASRLLTGVFLKTNQGPNSWTKFRPKT